MNNLDVETPYTSLAALRADHRHLQKLYRDTPDRQFDEIESFIRRGRATGAILDDEDHQAAAQSLLDFWATTLYRHGRTVPEATLMAFDPALAPHLADDVVPYVGLDSFVEQKGNMFFGRSRAVESLVSRLQKENLVAVIGPSGSGKSSLVLAGLIPALKSGAISGSKTWAYLGRMVPGSDALTSLVRSVARQSPSVVDVTHEIAQIKEDPAALLALVERIYPETPTVLVIDQCEELSTLCDDREARAAFENALVHLTTHGTVRHIVILTMRSDFIGSVASQPALQQILETALEHVTPLTAAELREAIERPAQQIGLKFETGVVDALIHDILGEPAALPLLQFTLLKLWESREHNRVTMDAYRALGGGRLALTKVADAFMAKLIPQDRVMADRIFLRLVRPGIGQDNVSNRICRRTLYTLGPEEHVSRVLDKLIAERLIRVTGETDADTEVEVAHEALVRNWLYLVKLLDGEREQQKTRVRLEAKAAEWVRLGRGEAGLLKSVALHEAEEWLAEADAKARASEQLHALVSASRKAADHAYRRKRREQVALITLTASACVLAGFAVWAMMDAKHSSKLADQRANEVLALTKLQKEVAEARTRDAQMVADQEREQRGEIERQAGEISKKDGELKERQRQLEKEKESALVKGRLYDASELASSAGDTIGEDPEGASLLALQGELLLTLNHQSVPTKIRASLYRAIHANRLRGAVPSESGEAVLAFSPDSRRFATGGARHAVRVWDTTTHKLLLTLPAKGTAAAFSWDNRQLVVAGNLLQFFEADSGNPIDTRDAASSLVTRLTFSPDGQFLAGAGSSNQAYLWALTQKGTAPRQLVVQDANRTDGQRSGETVSVRAVSFSPTGAFLATGGSDNLIRIWATDTATSLVTLPGHQRPINELAFLPDGRLVSGDDIGEVKLWRPFPTIAMPADTNAKPRTPTPIGDSMPGEISSFQLAAAPIKSLGVMPDGLRLMVLTGPDPAGAIPFAGPTVTPLDVSALTSRMLRGGPTFTLPARNATEFRMSPNATLVATAGPDGTQLWSTDRGSGTVLGTRLESVTQLSASTAGTFVTMSSNGVVREWDLRMSGREMTGAFALPGRRDTAFSLDGRRIALSCAVPASCPFEVYELSSQGRKPWTVASDPDGATAVALNHDGSVLGWATRARLSVSSVSSGKLLESTPLKDVTAIAFSPDGTRIAVSTGDRKVHLLSWNGQRFAPIAATPTSATPSNVTFNHDGTSLAAINADRTIAVWGVTESEGSALQLTSTLSGHGGKAVKSIAFSNDGRYLISGGDDMTARLWDLQSPDPKLNLLLTIDVGPKSVSGATFTDDQTGIVVSSDDGTLRWFPGPGMEFVPWALTRLTRGFENSECRIEVCAKLGDAVAAVVAGNQLAALGDERAAAAKYEAARMLVPGLPLQSRQDAERLAVESRASALRQESRGQLVQVNTLARADRVDAARAVLDHLPPPLRLGIDPEGIARSSRHELILALRGLAQSSARSQKLLEAQNLLEQAKKADPTQVGDIKTELATMSLEGEQQRAVSLLYSGNVAEAVSLLKALRRAGVTKTPFDSEGRLANELCWRGSLRTVDLAKDPEVRTSCETAIRLSEGKDAGYRDSRGVNRARNGDFVGAVEDFVTFVQDTKYSSSDRGDRQKWIERLSKKEDPFTPEVLERLR